MPYTFRCEFCGREERDADFSGPGHPCAGCGLVYEVVPTVESLKLVAARAARQEIRAAEYVRGNGKPCGHGTDQRVMQAMQPLSTEATH